MKVRTVVLTVALCAATLVTLFEYCWAADQADGAATEIGILSVDRILERSTKNAEHLAAVAAKDRKLLNDLDKLSAEIEAEEAVLKKLKRGSSDYLNQLKKVLEKKADLQTQEQYHKQRIEAEDRQWHEGLYRGILRIAGEVAAERGLALVLENSQPEFPTSTRTELLTTIRVHKVLYSGGCDDITDEVMARLDGQ